jgi:ATP adenylyltransferase
MTEAGQTKRTERFAFLRSTSECPRPIHDEILLEIDGCVVTPTLGSIVPNWLLIVPRSPVLNFAQWRLATGRSPLNLVEKVAAKRRSAERIVWFEHGPAESGSVLGCGVDQAHLHVIFDAPFSANELQTKAIENSGLDWSFGPAKSIYSNLQEQKSYLVAGSLETATSAQSVEQVGSQFFRRLIAGLSNQEAAWNYRTHPHLANIRETVRSYRTINEVRV